MELEQLKTFLAVAEAGSITKAADRLFLTQASVRQRLKGLENEIGVTLFKKDGRNITITEKGIAYISFASKMVTIMEKAETKLKEPLRRKGFITVAATTNFCTFVLISWLAKFRSIYPNMVVNLLVDFSRPITDQVLNGSVDIGFIKGPIEHKSLVIHPIYKETVIPVVSPDHPWFGRDVVPVQSLNDQPLIVWERVSSTWEGVEEWLLKQKIQIRTIMELEHIETCKRMVQKGHGISFLPDFTVENELAQGALGTFALDPPLTNSIQTDLILHRHQDHPILVRELVDFCFQMSSDAGRLVHGS